MEALSSKEFSMCECKSQTASQKLKALLESQPDINGIVIMGGGLPLAVLPLLIERRKEIKIGMFTENSSILQFKEIAFIAKYSQAETGAMAFDLLYKAASGKIDCSASNYPPFEILEPEN